MFNRFWWHVGPFPPLSSTCLMYHVTALSIESSTQERASLKNKVISLSHTKAAQFLSSYLYTMSIMLSLILTGYLLANAVSAQCPDYSDYSKAPHAPFSSGRYNLSYMRPDPSCRTFNSSIVESTITTISQNIADPDLKRLFQNTYPNTLDTAIKWKGYAANSDEELTFIITGKTAGKIVGRN